MKRGMLSQLLCAAAVLATTACGQIPAEKYGGQRIAGDWQQSILKGCSAEIKMRLPVGLLDVQQDWRLKAGSQNCPTGHASLRGTLQEFKAIVSSETAAKLERLDQLALHRIADVTAKYPDFDPNIGSDGTYCKTQVLKIGVNGRRNDKLLAQNMMPPKAGNTYEYKSPTLTSFGLMSLGQLMTYTERRLPNGTFEKVNSRPMAIDEYWHQPRPFGPGTVTLTCFRSYKHSNDKLSGGCQAWKDHSEAVYVEYRMCAALLPYWRQIDEAITAIVDDLVVSERLVTFVRQVNDPISDNLGRY